MYTVGVSHEESGANDPLGDGMDLCGTRVGAKTGQQKKRYLDGYVRFLKPKMWSAEMPFRMSQASSDPDTVVERVYQTLLLLSGSQLEIGEAVRVFLGETRHKKDLIRRRLTQMSQQNLDKHRKKQMLAMEQVFTILDERFGKLMADAGRVSEDHSTSAAEKDAGRKRSRLPSDLLNTQVRKARRIEDMMAKELPPNLLAQIDPELLFEYVVADKPAVALARLERVSKEMQRKTAPLWYAFFVRDFLAPFREEVSAKQKDILDQDNKYWGRPHWDAYKRSTLFMNKKVFEGFVDTSTLLSGQVEKNNEEISWKDVYIGIVNTTASKLTNHIRYQFAAGSFFRRSLLRTYEAKSKYVQPYNKIGVTHMEQNSPHISINLGTSHNRYGREDMQGDVLYYREHKIDGNTFVPYMQIRQNYEFLNILDDHVENNETFKAIISRRDDLQDKNKIMYNVSVKRAAETGKTENFLRNSSEVQATFQSLFQYIRALMLNLDVKVSVMIPIISERKEFVSLEPENTRLKFANSYAEKIAILQDPGALKNPIPRMNENVSETKAEMGLPVINYAPAQMLVRHGMRSWPYAPRIPEPPDFVINEDLFANLVLPNQEHYALNCEHLHASVYTGYDLRPLFNLNIGEHSSFDADDLNKTGYFFNNLRYYFKTGTDIRSVIQQKRFAERKSDDDENPYDSMPPSPKKLAKAYYKWAVGKPYS